AADAAAHHARTGEELRLVRSEGRRRVARFPEADAEVGRGLALATQEMRPAAPIRRITPSAYRVPTDSPEADGTLEWRATTVVVVVGAAREDVPVYGSGGFTPYSIAQLESQLGGWGEDGITRVKMKVGRDAGADVERVAAARRAIGSDAELFVDANGAYTRKE